MDLASKGMRLDGRKPDEFRKIVIEKDVIEKAEGSARVRMGETDVIVGVKFEVGEPFQDKPDQGVLMTSAEFSPVASPEFEKGPPSGEAIELARVVDRGIREAKVIELDKLFIEEGKVWKVFVDIQIVNHDGNLIDASALAAIAALWSTKMPEYDGTKIIYEKRTKKLPVRHKPVEVTLSKVGNNLFVDASLEEEGISSARLTLALKDDGNVCAVQKGGGMPFTIEELEQAMDIIKRKAEELRKLV